MTRRRKNKQASVPVVVRVNTGDNNPRQPQQQGQRRRPRKQRAPRSRNRRSFATTQHPCTTALARSMVQPWLYSACIPDSTRYLVPVTVKQTGSISTGTGGTVMGVLAGLQPDAFVLEDKNGTSAAMSIGANWNAMTAITSFVSLYSQYRLVSAGIRVWYTGSTLNDQGVIIVGQMSSMNNPLSTLNNGNLGTLSTGSMTYRVSPLREGATMTWRPEDNHGQADLYDVDATPNTTSSVLDHSYLYAYCFGAAAAAASSIQYEVTCNFECQLGNMTFQPGGMTPESSPAEGGWYETVGNMLRGVAPYAKPASDIANAAYNTYRVVSGNGNPATMRRMVSRLDL